MVTGQTLFLLYRPQQHGCHMLAMTPPGATALAPDMGGCAGFALDTNIDPIGFLPWGCDEGGDQTSILTDIR